MALDTSKASRARRWPSSNLESTSIRAQSRHGHLHAIRQSLADTNKRAGHQQRLQGPNTIIRYVRCGSPSFPDVVISCSSFLVLCGGSRGELGDHNSKLRHLELWCGAASQVQRGVWSYLCLWVARRPRFGLGSVFSATWERALGRCSLNEPTAWPVTHVSNIPILSGTSTPPASLGNGRRIFESTPFAIDQGPRCYVILGRW
ncbi:hypothetical protein C8Q79DRAFT_512289 [Trametes meyenii]|nr:hypothetical protein C8Q79DRAFT_512289 [Trametes meyenii]